MKVAWDPGMGIVDKAKKTSTSQASLKAVAEEFEALFLQQLLQQMRKTVPESELFGDRKAEKLFESLLDEEMSVEMSKAGGIGLSRIIYEQLVNFVADDD